jgi:hypothetical protein
MLAYMHQLGGGFVYIAPVSAIDPGFGGGRPGGVDPGFGLPGLIHPSQPIFHPGHPDHGLPSSPGHPSAGLPGSPGHPDNRPPMQPPVVAAGVTLVLVRDPVGVWHYATLDAGTPPPKPVPVPPPGTVAPPIAPTPAPKA